MRTLKEQALIIGSIMRDVGIYTRQHPLNLDQGVSTDWNMSAAVYVMITFGCTYDRIALALNISFAQVSRFNQQAQDSMHCVFFGAAIKCYLKAGDEALAVHENAMRIA